jgi:hypothetical protein
MYYRKNSIQGIIVEHLSVFLVVVFLCFMGWLSWYYAAATRDQVVFTVKDKETIATGSEDPTSSKYLVFTNIGTFENTDSFWYDKSDNSDLQRSLTIGHTYSATVYGYNIPVLRVYPNIVAVRDITKHE